MSKKLVVASVVALVIALGAVLTGISLVNYADTPQVQQRTISVSSEGTVKVKPDMAYINIGVQTENKSSKEAQQENAVKMNKVMQVL
jgi:uncharacterized protein YggE